MVASKVQILVKITAIEIQVVCKVPLKDGSNRATCGLTFMNLLECITYRQTCVFKGLNISARTVGLNGQ